MAFDPNLPAEHSPVVSAELRNQFTGLKAIFDPGLVPVGCMLPCLKSLSGVPVLPANWLECDGQTVSDPESPLNGVTLPDVNAAGRFLRGATTSGAVGGQDYFGTATADNAGVGSPFAAVTTDFSPGATPFPPYYTVVWVVRIK
jgi:hypothetical protein